MRFSPGILGYIPRNNIPAKVCCPSAFVENISRFKTRAPTVFYSDGDWPIADIKILNPEPIPNMEAKLKNGWPNFFVLNNFIFFTAMRIALARGFTHIIYLEADCRVGKDFWDDELFDFHFRSPEPLVCSGTAVAFNVATAGRDALARWLQWSCDQKMVPGFPCPSVYGWRGQSTTTEKPTVFVNGALGVYDVTWLKKLFGMDGLPPAQTKDNCKLLAESNFAWDFAIGYLLWQVMGVHSFNVVANNPRVYSGFGDVMSSEAERMQMLKDGVVSCVHQVKSSANL